MHSCGISFIILTKEWFIQHIFVWLEYYTLKLLPSKLCTSWELRQYYGTHKPTRCNLTRTATLTSIGPQGNTELSFQLLAIYLHYFQVCQCVILKMDSHLKTLSQNSSTICMFPVFRFLDQGSSIICILVVYVCKNILVLDTKMFKTCLLSWKEDSLSHVLHFHSNYHYIFY